MSDPQGAWTREGILGVEAWDRDAGSVKSMGASAIQGSEVYTFQMMDSRLYRVPRTRSRRLGKKGEYEPKITDRECEATDQVLCVSVHGISSWSSSGEEEVRLRGPVP